MLQAVLPALLKLCTSAPLPAYGAIQGDATGTLTQVGPLTMILVFVYLAKFVDVSFTPGSQRSGTHTANTQCTHTEWYCWELTVCPTAVADTS
jgi:hypothetical protein